MIYFNQINNLDSRSFEKQVEDESEGRYFLNNAKKLEHEREVLRHEYISGKITIKEYCLKSRVLIERVLSNIQKVEVFRKWWTSILKKKVI